MKNAVKVLGLLATIAVAAAGFLQAITPEYAAVVGAVAAAIFAFVEKIGPSLEAGGVE
jgi:hypothetical protein